MALTGACKISSVEEAKQLRQWLAEAQTGSDTDAGTLSAIQRALESFGI
jgi:hypothetical protein